MRTSPLGLQQLFSTVNCLVVELKWYCKGPRWWTDNLLSRFEWEDWGSQILASQNWRACTLQASTGIAHFGIPKAPIIILPVDPLLNAEADGGKGRTGEA